MKLQKLHQKKLNKKEAKMEKEMFVGRSWCLTLRMATITRQM